MKRLIHLVALFVGVCSILYSCNMSNNSKKQEPTLEPEDLFAEIVYEEMPIVPPKWFYGKWQSESNAEETRSFDSSYISDFYSLNELKKDTKFFILKNDAYVADFKGEDVAFIIGVKAGTRYLSGEYEIDSFIPISDSRMAFFGFFTFEGEEVGVIGDTYEKIGKGKVDKVPFKSHWIFGDWSSGEKKMSIKSPNLIYLEGFGWREFTLKDDVLTALLPQDGAEFILDDGNKTILEGNVRYVKGDYPYLTETESSNKKKNASSVSSSQTKQSNRNNSSIDKNLVVGSWNHYIKQSGNISTGNFETIVYKENLLLRADGTGWFNSRINEYVGGSLISTRPAASDVRFSWELRGNGIYINGGNYPDFTYSNKTLIDAGGNIFKK